MKWRLGCVVGLFFLIIVVSVSNIKNIDIKSSSKIRVCKSESFRLISVRLLAGPGYRSYSDAGASFRSSVPDGITGPVRQQP